MRYTTDHPRPWSEIRHLLTEDDARACEQFAWQHGVDLNAPHLRDAAEGWYQEWQLSVSGQPPRGPFPLKLGLLVLLALCCGRPVSAAPIWLCTAGHCEAGTDPVVGPYMRVFTDGGVLGTGLGFGNEQEGSEAVSGLFTFHARTLGLRFHWVTDEPDPPGFRPDYPWVRILGPGGFTRTVPLDFQATHTGWTGPFGFDLPSESPWQLQIGVVNEYDNLYPSTFAVALPQNLTVPNPEPGTLVLVGGGLAAAYARYRRQRRGRLEMMGDERPFSPYDENGY